MDIQKQQFFNLLLVILLGILFSNFYLLWYEVMAVLLFTVIASMVILWQLNQAKKTLDFSSLTTSIGVMLMMASSHLWIYFIVITLALIQKNYLKIEGKHLFNPSNFALIIALLFFYKDAHIVLGQLGDELWLAILLTLMAVAILVRVNRWIIPLSFTLFYLFFQYIFVLSYDPVLLMEDIYYRFYSLSFILFILFMLTDPKTTPKNSIYQIFFALFIALLTSLLDRYYGFRVQHLFLSLFFFSLFTPLAVNYSKSLLLKTAFVAFIVIVVIITIESKTPYYFSMEH
jgi:hypothetical protein